SVLASELRESTTSLKAAQAEVAHLAAAIKHKNGRLRTLNDNYERRLRVADTTITTHTAELSHLQDRVSSFDRDLQKASQPAQAATSQRDQARAAHIATREYLYVYVFRRRTDLSLVSQRIVSQQLAIPSLGWKSELTKSRSPRRRVRISSPRSRRFNKERDALAVQRDELLGQLGERFMEITDLRAERDQAQEKLFNIASLLPSAPGHKRARYESESPIPSARGSKAARSTSSSSPASVSSRVPAFGSSIEVLSAVAAGRTAERLILPLVLLVIFLDLSDRPPRLAAEVLRRPLQLRRRTCILTATRVLLANPVQLMFLTPTPRGVTV
ncbi:hypothetical protein F443_22655, partial [Phytophthora nicotianae P1569]